MITSSFYSDNLFRAYPFKDNYSDDSTIAPRLYKTVAGAKIMVYAESAFVNNFPRAYLVSWMTLTDRYQLTFQVKDKTNVIVTKTITIPKTTPPFTKFTSDDKDAVVISLIIGDVSNISQSWYGLNMQLEPTCLLWYKHRGISNIYVVNQERHRLRLENNVIDPEYRKVYGKVDWWLQPEEGLTSISNGNPCLFNGGFNCTINQINLGQNLQFIPQTNAGLGEATEDIALGYTVIDDTYFVETSPAFNLRKDGIPTIANVVYHVSSATGPEILLVADTAISVRPELNISTIFIGVATLFGESC
jgi:hypothetical protein